MWILGQLFQIAGVVITVVTVIGLAWISLALILAFWKPILGVIVLAVVIGVVTHYTDKN